ncbi:MAG: nucleotide pyrophosphohydrolase [Gemmataceae bacterium]
MSDETTTVAALKAVARRFAAERNWDPYHSPKNLVMALACEAGELVEPFRWLTEEQSRSIVYADPVARNAIAEEMADVFSLLLQVSIQTGIDLSDALRAKTLKNAVKYPVPERGTQS